MNKIKTEKMKPNVPVVLTDLVSVDGTARFPVNDCGNGVLLVLYSEDVNTATIQGGDGVFAADSLSVELNGGEYVLVQLETGPYTVHNGENKGMIIVKGDYDIYAHAIQMP